MESMRVAQATVLVDVALTYLWPDSALWHRRAVLALASPVWFEIVVEATAALMLHAELAALASMRAGCSPGLRHRRLAEDVAVVVGVSF
jgi:hypothetical protein